MPGSHSTALRALLGIDRHAFSRLIGVDTRTMARWDDGISAPEGAGGIVLGVFVQQVEDEGPDGPLARQMRRLALTDEGLGSLLRGLLANRAPRLNAWGRSCTACDSCGEPDGPARLTDCGHDGCSWCGPDGLRRRARG